MPEKYSPCIEKDCSWCCNPVKVRTIVSESEIPANESGEKIWKPRKEIWVSEEHPDTDRIRTYDCSYYDGKTGRCIKYENRPEICRSTSCVKDNSDKSIDEQRKETIESKYIVIKEDKE